MKKYILSLVLGLTLVFSPLSVQAQTATEDAYRQALIQLITLLQQQVATLMAQLVAIQQSQTQITEQVNQIVQTYIPPTTTPTQTTPPVGSSTPPPVVSTPAPVTPTYDYSIQPTVSKASDFVINGSNIDLAGRIAVSTNGGEPIYLDRAEVTTNLPNSSIFDGSTLLFWFSSNGVSASHNNPHIATSKEFMVKAENSPLAPGTYNITINSLRAVGLSSGEYKQVSGLPITFTFEIND
jgi:hypothetical protein